MKKILCLGHCGFDGPQIKTALTSHFKVDCVFVPTAKEAEQALSKETFALVLVNRLFDTNGASGIAWIQSQQGKAPSTPCMLVSNYPEAQDEAIKSGAVRGFGKADLGTPRMYEMFAGIL